MKNKILFASSFFVLLAACSQPDTSSVMQETPTEGSVSNQPPLVTEIPHDSIDATSINYMASGQNLGDYRSFGTDLGDLDMDGDLDIFFSNYTGSSEIWLNDGAGMFTMDSQRFEFPAHDGVIADLNGDDFPDIFLLLHNQVSKVYFNDEHGVFLDSGQEIGSQNETPQKALLDDVDGDGDLDMFTIFSNSYNRLWLNDGEGVFSLTDNNFGGSSVHKMDLADFSGDSFPDLILCNRNSPCEFWINDGTGIFSPTGHDIGNQVGAEDITSGDVDGDGDLDVMIAKIDSGISIYLNQDNGASFQKVGEDFEPGVFLLELFDADLDGDLDLISMKLDGDNNLWLNDGNGHFIFQVEILSEARALSVAVADLNSDMVNDIVFGVIDGAGGNKIFYIDSN